MFKKNTLIALALILAAKISTADILETNRTFKEYIVHFEKANNIRLNFEYTQEVDSCNGHGLNANLHTINSFSYLAELSIISTEMFCEDNTMHSETFFHSVDIVRGEGAGSFFYILVPSNTKFSAEAIE